MALAKAMVGWWLDVKVEVVAAGMGNIFFCNGYNNVLCFAISMTREKVISYVIVLLIGDNKKWYPRCMRVSLGWVGWVGEGDILFFVIFNPCIQKD